MSMSDAEVRSLVNGLPVGTTLRLTFGERNAGDVVYLYAMLLQGGIDAQGIYPLAIMAVGKTSSWEGFDRTFEVQTTESFNVDLFVDRMPRALESLRVL